jgi:hypothetical protein
MALFKEFINKFKKNTEISNATTENISSSDWIRQLQVTGLGGFKSKFVSDIYKERILYPHEEMAICRKAYFYNAYVNSAVNTRANFMTGGILRVVSDDAREQKLLQDLVDSNGMNRVVSKIGNDLIATGNFYAERIYSGGKIVYYDYVPHPERMYINLDEKGLVSDYFQEVPETWNGKFKSIKYYGDRRKSIKGIPLEKAKIFHIKMGVAEIPVYGRGPVASVVNDIEIMLEIERAIAIISRYKAIPKKIIQLERDNSPESVKAAQIYANMLSQMSDVENPIMPEKFKIDDLSYSGRDISFQPFMDYLKRKITVALAPSFIMHGEETNYAVSRDQKEAFILQVQGERQELSYQLTKEIKRIIEVNGLNVKNEFWVEFGDFDLGQTEEKIRMATESFTKNIITLNEAREMLDLGPDKELGDSYYSEIATQGNLLGLASSGSDLNDED